MNLSRHTYIFLFVLIGLLSTMKPECLYATDKSAGSLSIAHKEAMPGTTVDVPVTVSGFTNVIVMEIHIVFNQYVLTPEDDAKDFIVNLHPIIANAQFGLYNDSTIILTWFNLNGRTLPDEEKLFDLRLPFCMDGMFCAVYGGKSALTFNVNKTYLVRSGFVSIPLTLNNGSVFSPVETFDLNIDKTGNGSISVNEVLYTGTMSITGQATITLQAFPDEGWQFDTWSGDLSGNDNPSSLLMDSEKQVSVTFTTNFHTITATPNDPDHGSVTGSGTYEHGQQVILEATATAGYLFVNWTEGGVEVSTSPVYSFTATANRELVAHFRVMDAFEVSTVVVPEGSGSTTGDGAFQTGVEVTVEASAAAGYDFVAWKDTDEQLLSTNLLYTFLMPAHNLSLTAYFELKTYTITATPNDPDYGSVTGSGTYEHGQQLTLEATAAEGYVFVNWTEGGVEVSTTPAYSFTATASRELVAHFRMMDAFEVSTIVVPEGSGSTTGDGMFWEGEEVSVEANPAAGYDFVAWKDTEEQVLSSNPLYTFIMPARNVTLTAYFELKTYTITATADDPDHGLVTGSGTYEHGQMVSLEATPAEAYSFVHWKEEGQVVSADLPYEFTATADRELVAHFEIKTYTITATADDPDHGSVTGSGTYEHGQLVSLEAIPAVAYRFVHWTEDEQVVSTNTPYEFTATADRELVAHFEKDTYTISANAYPSDGGLINGESSYTGEFEYGEEVTLHAVANEGFEFVGWLEGGNYVEGATAEYTFLVESDRSLVANFDVGSVIIQAVSSPAEGGSISGAGVYHYGAEVSLTAVPSTGYRFVKWTEDGLEISTEPTYVFIVEESRSLVAHFELQSYTISVSSAAAEMGTASGGGTYRHGDEVRLEAVATTGHRFVNWTEDGTPVSTNPVYVFQATGNRILLAHFAAITYTVTASVSPQGSGTVSGTGGFTMGEQVTLKAIASEGYYFVEWRNDDEVISTEDEYAFSMPDSNVHLTAYFSLKSYTILASPNDPAYGSVSGSGEYEHGTQVILEASPVTGYSFVHWAENGDVVSSDSVYSFAVFADRELVAYFEKESYSIRAEAFPSDGGLINGESPYTGMFEYGEEVTLHAIADNGFEFVGWLEGGSYIAGADAEYTFTVNSNRSLVANFDVGSVVVQAMASPVAGGNVTGAGIYQYGNEVNLIATPSEGYLFVRWTEGEEEVSTDPSYVFTIEGNRSLVAHFELKTYTVSVLANQAERGSVSGGGIYQHADQVIVEAIPEPGYRFENWSENDVTVSTDRIYTFTASKDRELVASFVRENFTVSASVYPEGTGNVNGNGEYPLGDEVRMEATAEEGYEFIEWRHKGGEQVSDEPVYVFSMPAHDVELEAHFSLKSYTISAVPNVPDYGSVSGAGDYDHGTEVLLEAVPSDGHHFVNWTENDTTIGTETTLVFLATSNRNIAANFAVNTFIIGASAGEGGSITPSGEVIVPYGSNASFAIEAAEGYSIAEVWVDGQGVGQVTSYVFEKVVANHNIFAEFSPMTYEVSFNVNMTYVTMDYAGFDFNPEIHKVYLAGNMSGEWVMPGEDPDKQLMTNSNDNAKIYQITLHLEAGTYAYNYFINEGWGGQEWEGNTNREVVVSGDMEVNDWFGSPTDPTGISDFSESPVIRVYPVPASDRLIVESDGIIQEVEVLDILGRQMMHQPVKHYRQEINVSSLNTGLYLIRVRTSAGYDSRVIHIAR